MTRTGRRPGTPATRDAILAVARRQFATRGYDATSLRAIASEAEVDPALLIHYFSSKEGLFVAATGLPADMPEMFGSLATLPVPEAAEALIRMYLKAIDSDKSRNALLAAMFREFVTAALLNIIARLTGHPDAHLRASLIAAQLVGIAMLRHVIRVEPIAKASPDQIVTLVAPVIEHYLL